MLTISRTVYRAMSRALEESFADELERRMHVRAPGLARTFDEPRLARFVRATIAAARARGFTYRGPVRLYFDLCLAFGSGFGEDPMYPWAAKAIGNRDPATQMARADVLFAASVAAFEAIHGPRDEHARAAVDALRAWARAPHAPADADDESVVLLLRSLHPQRAAHGGTAALHELVREARAVCGAMGLSGQPAITLISTLKFSFGARCLRDPLHGWIAATLADPGSPMTRRLERLERGLLRWIDAVHDEQPAG